MSWTKSVFIGITSGFGAYIIMKILKLIISKKNQHGSNVRNGVLDLMHDTPMIYIKSLSELTGCNIYAKCEYFLPYTSKDRMIKNIILDAKRNNIITKDTTIYEGSSGSTAYSVAAISRLLGYKCKIVVPDDVSQEKMNLLKTTQCVIVITKQCPFSNFNDNYVRLAKKLSKSDPNGFYIDQFFNKVNRITHYTETGPEIYADLKGKIDAFVSSAGTGGTISGISNYLKEKDPNIQIFLADVQGSGLESYVKNKVMYTSEESEAMRQKYRYYSIIEGIGINFVNENISTARIDSAFKITDDEAIFMANYVYQKDGLFIGGSSAVNLCGVLKASAKLGQGKTIVTVLFDSGLKYTSKLFNRPVNQLGIKSIEQIFN